MNNHNIYKQYLITQKIKIVTKKGNGIMLHHMKQEDANKK